VKPKLFYAPGACSLAPHIALLEAGAEVELVRVDLHKAEQRRPEYLALNPKGRVPLLVAERGTLTEAPAILAWIAQTWPQARLSPADPWAAAQVNSFNAYLSSTLHVTFATHFRPARFAQGTAAAEAMAEYFPTALAQAFAFVEAQLETSGGPWVHGEGYTTSDPYLLTMARWAKRVGADMSPFPRIAAHTERALARPAVQRAFAAEEIVFG
jgi:glutathione S-transferase